MSFLSRGGLGSSGVSITACASIFPVLRGLKRWDAGRWVKGHKLPYSRIYNRNPLIHLALSHLLSPLMYYHVDEPSVFFQAVELVSGAVLCSYLQMVLRQPIRPKPGSLNPRTTGVRRIQCSWHACPGVT